MDWLRKKREDDLERELRDHLELEAEEQRGNRLSPEEARFAARRALGNTTLIREETREAWGYVWLERLEQDLRYAARSLRNNPGFATVAIVTAALGIGANTSIFSIVQAVLLRQLPYKNPARLVTPDNVAKDDFLGLRVAEFQYGAWRDQAEIFESVAAYTGIEFTLTGEGAPERIKGQVATPGYLRVLGVAPAIGRELTEADAGTGRRAGTVALITHPFWMGRFRGDPAVLSRTLTLDGKLYTIAGVLPRGFELPGNPAGAVLLAFHEPPAQPGNGTYFYSVLGRLKAGITLQRAETDLALITGRLESAYPKKFTGRRAGAQVHVTSIEDHLVGNVRPALLALAGAVALVLLIVCVNVSNLLLARASARRREIAVRLALGAGRGRLVRQLLTEALLLAGLGALGGLCIAFGGIKLLCAIAPAAVPHVQDAHVGGTVLAFNLAIAILSGILFGLAPLHGAARLDDSALRQTSRVSSGRGHRRVENLLIVSETAFALILLAGAGLLLRTFASLTAIAPGFQPENVVVARVSLPYWKYATAERQHAFRDSLLERARVGPLVDAVAAIACLPYDGFMMLSSPEVEGRPKQDAPDEADNTAVNFAAGDYFRALGIPIREGRALNAADTAGRPAVAVVNEAFARRLFPGASPIGARIRVSGVTGWLDVVGVAGNVKQVGLAGEPRPEIWQSAAQVESGGSAQTLAIRSAADPRLVIPWLRTQIAELDRDLPVPEIETMRTRMAALMSSQIFVLRLLGLFAAMAIILAAIGIYSVLAYSVERRAHEIGIRLALGAKPSNIMGLVLGRGLRLAILGSVAGTAGGLALTRYLRSLLYGVTPHDSLTLGAGCALVVLVAVGAAYLPARRAVDQDTVQSLRAE